MPVEKITEFIPDTCDFESKAGVLINYLVANDIVARATNTRALSSFAHGRKTRY